MSIKLLKLCICAALIAVLLIDGACTTTQPSQNTTSVTSGTEEAEMDPQIEHDVQLVIDAFPDGVEYFKSAVTHSVVFIRDNGIGPFVSVESNVDEEISSYDRAIGIAFMLDIVDDTGACYRVGFASSGLAVKIYLPPSYFFSISVPPPPIG